MRKRLILVLLLSNALALVANAQATSGTLEVRVTRNGVAVSNATVCVGLDSDLNRYFQGTTDGLGLARVSGVPPSPFVVTATAQGNGARQTFTTAMPLSFMIAQIALPPTSTTKGAPIDITVGPLCPTTAAGPSRSLIPRDLELPAATISPSAPITLARSEFCFGALGAGCGEPQTGIPFSALCTNGMCFINGGSWLHDECCHAFPLGYACRRGPADAVTGHDGRCVNEWNKALALVSKGVMWSRSVNFSRANNSGRVEFSLYCAPNATLVSPEDANRCCSGGTRPLTIPETARAVAVAMPLVACG